MCQRTLPVFVLVLVTKFMQFAIYNQLRIIFKKQLSLYINSFISLLRKHDRVVSLKP